MTKDLILLEKAAFLQLKNNDEDEEYYVEFILFSQSYVSLYKALFCHNKFVIKKHRHLEKSLPSYIDTKHKWWDLCFYLVNDKYTYYEYYDRFPVLQGEKIIFHKANQELNLYINDIMCEGNNVIVIGDYIHCPLLLYILQSKGFNNLDSISEEECIELPCDKDYLLVDESKLLLLYSSISSKNTTIKEEFCITITESMFGYKIRDTILKEFIPEGATYTYSVANEKFYILKVCQEFNIFGDLCCNITCGNKTKQLQIKN